MPYARTGKKVRVEFASQEKVSSDPALSDDFIERILGLEGAWISDESSLWDFHSEQTNEHLYAKIREVYGVDVSDIKPARLWAIFERIAESRHLSSPTSLHELWKRRRRSAAFDAATRRPLSAQLRRR